MSRDLSYPDFRTMRYSSMLAGALLALPALAAAQGGTLNPDCVATTARQAATQDACQKASDIFAYMAPQLAGALAGNHVTGIGNFLPLTLSISAVQGYVPKFESATPVVTGPQRSDYAVTKAPVPMPAVTGNFTLFKGINTGFGRVGGLSAIGTVTVIPGINVEQLNVSTLGNGFGLGYGAQVRVFDEGWLRPEVSIAAVKRSTPMVRLLASPTVGDSIRSDSMQVRTQTVRVEASKHVGWFGLVIGAAQDEYDSKAVVSGSVTAVESDRIALSQSLTRTNAYAGITIGILRATVGQVKGGAPAPTYNTFSEREGTTVTARPVDQAYRYGTFSIRLNF